MWRFLAALSVFSLIIPVLASPDQHHSKRHVKAHHRSIRHSKTSRHRKNAFTIRRFNRLKFAWAVVLLPGETSASIMGFFKGADTKPVFVSTFGFIDPDSFYPANLHIINGRMEIPVKRPKEKVLADFPLLGPTIFGNAPTCLSYGRPPFAASLMTVPPDPDNPHSRRIWATKGSELFVVEYFGSRADGIRILTSYGLKASGHSDGGHMVSPYAKGSSFAMLVERDKLPAVIVKLSIACNFRNVSAW